MLLLWMCMCVCACVARACNDGSRWSVLIDVCSLVRPEGIGAGWASHPLKIHTGIPFGGCNVSVYVCGVCGSVCVCVRVCVTPLQTGELEAITGQRVAIETSGVREEQHLWTVCLWRQVFLFLPVTSLSSRHCCGSNIKAWKRWT